MNLKYRNRNVYLHAHTCFMSKQFSFIVISLLCVLMCTLKTRTCTSLKTAFFFFKCLSKFKLYVLQCFFKTFKVNYSFVIVSPEIALNMNKKWVDDAVKPIFRLNISRKHSCVKLSIFFTNPLSICKMVGKFAIVQLSIKNSTFCCNVNSLQFEFFFNLQH